MSHSEHAIPESNEVVVGPLLGWRLWLCYRGWGHERQRWLLWSTCLACRWSPREPMMATCIVSDFYTPQHKHHVVPHIGCVCGIYAYKLAATAEKQIRGIKDALYSMSEFSVVIVGTVSIWGRIVEHKNGYRAEYAYPSSLCVLVINDFPRMNEIKELARELSNSYQVPAKICKVYPMKSGLWPVPVKFERKNVLDLP